MPQADNLITVIVSRQPEYWEADVSMAPEKLDPGTLQDTSLDELCKSVASAVGPMVPTNGELQCAIYTDKRDPGEVYDCTNTGHGFSAGTRGQEPRWHTGSLDQLVKSMVADLGADAHPLLTYVQTGEDLEKAAARDGHVSAPPPPLAVAVDLSGRTQRHYWIDPLLLSTLALIPNGFPLSVPNDVSKNWPTWLILVVTTWLIGSLIYFAGFLTLFIVARWTRISVTGSSLRTGLFVDRVGYRVPNVRSRVTVDLSSLTLCTHHGWSMPLYRSLIVIPPSVEIRDRDGNVARIPVWGWTGQKRLLETVYSSLQQSGAKIDAKSMAFFRRRLHLS